MSIDPREYRSTIGLFATGVTVITASDGDHIRGMTATLLTSGSLNSVWLPVCIDRNVRMAPVISATAYVVVTVLRVDREAITHHCAGRPQPHREVALEAVTGAPVLADSLATPLGSRERLVDGGDHLIVLRRVIALRRAAEGDLLLYVAGAYRQVAEMVPTRAATGAPCYDTFC